MHYAKKSYKRLGETMELHQLRCFVAVADEFHFGRAAQRLDMLPSSLGRHIRLLEEDLGTLLISRTTRNVTLTAHGELLLEEAKTLLARADSIAARMRARSRDVATSIRIGAIDSAAAGLVPRVIFDFKKQAPKVSVDLVEDKTVRLLPRLLSGRLDLAFVRPQSGMSRRYDLLFLVNETPVVALPKKHPLASKRSILVKDLVDVPLILPERKTRPHSHDLTVKLFAEAGLPATIAQHAEEKHTIVNLVSAGVGAAIVPRWTSKLGAKGVSYVPLAIDGGKHVGLPLAAVWVRGSRDSVRDELLKMIKERISSYFSDA